MLTSLEGAFSIGSHFTILPKIHFGWYGVPLVTIGGFLPNRYTERQIPYFGFATGFRDCLPISLAGQMDLRYCFAGKNFVTARAGMFIDSFQWKDFFQMGKYPAYGLEYARQTMVGPLRVAVQWGEFSGFSAYASVGFDF